MTDDRRASDTMETMNGITNSSDSMETMSVVQSCISLGEICVDSAKRLHLYHLDNGAAVLTFVLERPNFWGPAGIVGSVDHRTDEVTIRGLHRWWADNEVTRLQILRSATARVRAWRAAEQDVSRVSDIDLMQSVRSAA